MMTLAQARPEAVEHLHQTATAFFGMAGAVLFVGTVMVLMGALLLLTMVVAPDVTARGAAALRQRNFTSFAVGGGMTLAIVILGAVVGPRAPILGLAWAMGAAVFVVVGAAAASEDLGRRIFWHVGRDGNRVAHLLSGWAVFAAAASIPLLGWFAVGPYLLISGIGSCVTGLFSGGAPSAAPARRDEVDLEIR